MTKSELYKFKRILEAKLAEVAQVLRNHDEIVVERNADELDDVQCATERELAVRNLDRESKLLRDIRAALCRVHEGSFGICVDCIDEISPKRLAAVPWSPLCIRCQEAVDRGAEATDAVEELTAITAVGHTNGISAKAAGCVTLPKRKRDSMQPSWSTAEELAS